MRVFPYYILCMDVSTLSLSYTLYGCTAPSPYHILCMDVQHPLPIVYFVWMYRTLSVLHPLKLI